MRVISTGASKPSADRATPKPLHVKELAAFWTVCIVWGTTFAAIHTGIQTIPPGLFISARFILAGLGLLLITVGLLKQPWPSLSTVGRNALIGFFLFSTGNALAAWGLQHVPTGLGAMITATSPFCMMGLSALVPPREHVRPIEWGLFCLGFAGLVVMFSHHFWDGHQLTFHAEPLFWLGTGLLFLMTLSWTVGALIARRWPSQSSLLMDVGLQNLIAGLLLFPVATWGLDLTQFPHLWAPSGLLSLAYLILFGTMITTPCYLYTIQALPLSVSGATAYVAPSVTVLVGLLFLHEPFNWTMGLGMAIILACVWALQRPPKLSDPKPDSTLMEGGDHAHKS